MRAATASLGRSRAGGSAVPYASCRRGPSPTCRASSQAARSASRRGNPGRDSPSRPSTTWRARSRPLRSPPPPRASGTGRRAGSSATPPPRASAPPSTPRWTTTPRAPGAVARRARSCAIATAGSASRPRCSRSRARPPTHRLDGRPRRDRADAMRPARRAAAAPPAAEKGFPTPGGAARPLASMHDLHDAGAAEGPVLPDDEERIRRDTDEVIRLYGEFLRRLSHQGVRDIADLVRLHDQVSRAAATVALPEIDFALTQIRALIDRV